MKLPIGWECIAAKRSDDHDATRRVWNRELNRLNGPCNPLARVDPVTTGSVCVLQPRAIRRGPSASPRRRAGASPRRWRAQPNAPGARRIRIERLADSGHKYRRPALLSLLLWASICMACDYRAEPPSLADIGTGFAPSRDAGADWIGSICADNERCAAPTKGKRQIPEDQTWAVHDSTENPASNNHRFALTLRNRARHWNCQLALPSVVEIVIRCPASASESGCEWRWLRCGGIRCAAPESCWEKCSEGTRCLLFEKCRPKRCTP